MEATMRYHCTSIGLLSLKLLGASVSARMWRKRPLGHCSWEVKWNSYFGKQLNHFLRRKIYTQHVIQKLHPREMKTYIRTKMCTMTFITALFVIAKNKTTPMSISRWVNKFQNTHAKECHQAISVNEQWNVQHPGWNSKLGEPDTKWVHTVRFHWHRTIEKIDLIYNDRDQGLPGTRSGGLTGEKQRESFGWWKHSIALPCWRIHEACICRNADT